MSPISAEEANHFELLAALLNGDGPTEVQVAVSRGLLDGEEIAMIVAVFPEGKDVSVRPLAVLVTSDLFERLTPPVEPDEVLRG